MSRNRKAATGSHMSETPTIMLTDQTLISRNQSLLVAPVHDETVMMDFESGHYYGLDDIGSDVWQRLEEPRRFAELVDDLAGAYDADRATIAGEVEKLLVLMATHNVVTFSQS
jgi:Coenzyme PQQ synthesis protein D (PqqD)